MDKSVNAGEIRRALDDATSDDDRARILAERTDVSPNQAKVLFEKYGRDNQRIASEACLYKAEG